MRAIWMLLIVAGWTMADEAANARAWEAHLLGETGDVRHTRDLVRMLHRDRDTGGPEGHHLRRTILDALLRVGAKLPASDLLALRKRHPTPVFLLMARNWRANRRALLEVMKGGATDLEWVAAGNLLVCDPPPGFAAYLLAQYPVALHVRVRDKGTPWLRPTKEADRQVVVRRRIEVPEGWPPQRLHVLLTRGGVPLAEGACSVFVERRECKPGNAGFAAVESVPTRGSLIQGYLARMMRLQWDQAWVQAHHDVFPLWKDAESLQAQVAASRKAIGTNWDGLKQRLVKLGRLTPEESESLPLELTVEIRDERTDRTAPLAAE